MVSDGDESLYNVLNNIRIVKENLVYIIGISPKIAEEKVTAFPDTKITTYDGPIWEYRKVHY